MRLLLLLLFTFSLRAEWVHPGFNTNAFTWGRRGGLLFAVPPDGFRATEPRGLIRLGYPVHASGKYELVNFIAIEPVVGGKKGFSELEMSALDSKRGKRLTVISPASISADELSLKLAVEKFENGAEVEIEIRQRAEAPDEIRLTTRVTTNSAPLEYCILTATMGNMVRARELWLKREAIHAKTLYPGYADEQFAPHKMFSLDQLFKSATGDVIIAVTTDEKEPAISQPHRPFWHYTGQPVTQFWKKRAGTFRDDLHAAVNARYMYWGSKRPIPNGISYENFELREKFFDGQEFIFGVTSRTPADIGFQAAK